MAVECVIFVGLPAAGKTTFYRQRFESTHSHISKDRWPNAPRKHERQARELRAALATGASVVVDNTSPSPAERAAIIGIAREFNARVVGYYFTAAAREAIGRNRGREGRERVPDVAIFTAAKRMVPPRLDEGFDELFGVAAKNEGVFEITPL